MSLSASTSDLLSSAAGQGAIRSLSPDLCHYYSGDPMPWLFCHYTKSFMFVYSVVAVVPAHKVCILHRSSRYRNKAT